MTQEEKNILLKDLCGRILYNVFCECTYVKPILHTTISSKRIDILSCKMIYELDLDENLTWGMGYYSEIKPYLRPMNSMTDEEKKKVHYFVENHKYGNCSRSGAISDYLDSIHVDYRGLIEKGLALPAKEGMYMKGGEK